MRLYRNNFAGHAAIVLLLPVFLVAGCQKQNNNARQAHENNAPQAQEQLAGAGRPRLRVVCADDIQKYCANADRKRRCLRENMDKLSDACKTALSQRGGGRRARDNNGGGDE